MIFTTLARRLARAGVAVLRFDFRGSGDSSGAFVEMTLATECADALAAYRHLLTCGMDRSRIGILGLSMGAVPASYVAGRERLRSLCLWAPLAHPTLIRDKMLTRRMKRELAAHGKTYHNGYWIGRLFINSLSRFEPLSYAAGFGGHALVVHSKDDGTLPLEYGLDYFRALHQAARSCEMIILNEGNHTFTTRWAEETVLKATTDFFAETL